MQGRFKLKHPEKYKGNASNVVYRSSWELKIMIHLDHDTTVSKWSSEENVIAYRSPVDGRLHRYFVDFMVERVDSSGNRTTTLIEVKPEKETVPPKVTKNKKSRHFITESMTYAKNLAKWEAAKKYCESRGWKFVILTERHLFGKKS
jgi:hypothetical protein